MWCFRATMFTVQEYLIKVKNRHFLRITFNSFGPENIYLIVPRHYPGLDPNAPCLYYFFTWSDKFCLKISFGVLMFSFWSVNIFHYFRPSETDRYSTSSIRQRAGPVRPSSFGSWESCQTSWGHFESSWWHHSEKRCRHAGQALSYLRPCSRWEAKWPQLPATPTRRKTWR